METVVIAGGGLAGSASACLLARARRPVLLMERAERAVPKICGEFISAEAAYYLGKLGVNIQELGASEIRRVSLIQGRNSVETSLPFDGFGLSRAILDEALLEQAAKFGAEILRGRTVERITLDSRRFDKLVEVSGGQMINTRTVFLATGKHDIRGIRRREPKHVEDLVGLKLHWRLSREQQKALSGRVEIILFADGYAGLQLVERGIANLCFLILADRLRSADGNWSQLLEQLLRTEPHLRVRLNGAKPLDDRPTSVYRVPYGFVHRAANDDPEEIFRLGDQVGVIPSFTGDGMSIALHSAALASAIFLSGGNAGDYHRSIRRDIEPQICLAGALNRLLRKERAQSFAVRVATVLPRSVALAAGLTRIAAHRIKRTSDDLAALSAM